MLKYLFIIMRASVTVAHRAHNPKALGSIPKPAISMNRIERMNMDDDISKMNFHDDIWIVIAIIATLGLSILTTWVLAGEKSDAYFRATGKRIPQWDAMFLELRVENN